ncbi:LysR family transcriptional regulator [Marinobacterium lutimaris]|uniref:DNA-binding transcriptional regulator, LysR family n=1 Tax=Marinobacterium lutimaris TaxID=568106 RepID=A0A1H5WUQ5_9GAMM|nr:LysR family transcriptional regulator [Marinobacterium lutimaris]SEG03035.1 DNA-binding transcriptional regulator, LysR family [Marinobacterium lutimaris]
MNLNDLSLFIRVVETGSFTSAAETLNVQKSTISRRIAQLEDGLGVRLIQRTTRKIKLTLEGRELFERSRELIGQLEVVRDEIAADSHELRGRLRMTMPSELGTMLMTEVIASFIREYPSLDVDVELSTRAVDLIEEGMDLALRMGPLPDSSMIARRIASLSRGLYASPKYLEKNGQPKTPEDLAQHQCITLVKPFDTWRFMDWNDGEPVTYGGQLRTNSLSFAREMAVEGTGICRMPRVFLNNQVEEGKLVEVLTDFTMTPTEINAVYASRRNLTPRVRAFLDHMTESLQNHPWISNCTS